MTTFFVALGYVGYINEQLKGAVSGADRAVLLTGFIIGVYAAARYVLAWAARSIKNRGAMRSQGGNVR